MTTIAVELKDVETLIMGMLSSHNGSMQTGNEANREMASLDLTFEVFRKRNDVGDEFFLKKKCRNNKVMLYLME